VTLAEVPDTGSPPEVAPPPPPAASATIAFAVSPWGEVVVDGQSFGATPPLTHLPLPPGEHLVEIRNGVSDPYRTLVRIEPEQVLRIQHKFEQQRRSQ
jgi:serine/threonine-protein kinase